MGKSNTFCSMFWNKWACFFAYSKLYSWREENVSFPDSGATFLEDVPILPPGTRQARVGTWGADPTHLSLLGLGGSRGVVTLVSVVIPARSIPARTLPAPVLLSSPCVLSLSATLLNLGFGQQQKVWIYIQSTVMRISSTFSSNSTLIWEPEEAKEFHLGEFRAGMGASGWSDPAYK